MTTDPGWLPMSDPPEDGADVLLLLHNGKAVRRCWSHNLRHWPYGPPVGWRPTFDKGEDDDR